MLYDYLQIRDVYTENPGHQPIGTTWKGLNVLRIDEPKADNYRVTFSDGHQDILEGYEFVSVPQEKKYQ